MQEYDLSLQLTHLYASRPIQIYEPRKIPECIKHINLCNLVHPNKAQILGMSEILDIYLPLSSKYAKLPCNLYGEILHKPSSNVNTPHYLNLKPGLLEELDSCQVFSPYQNFHLTSVIIGFPIPSGLAAVQFLEHI